VEELHAVITGRVQGVGFRATTRRFALELGLTGWVRNVGDDRVELVAQGSREGLLKLIERLNGAFNERDISEMRTDFRSLKKSYTDFSITLP
jgi:acylphosphatase